MITEDGTVIDCFSVTRVEENCAAGNKRWKVCFVDGSTTLVTDTDKDNIAVFVAARENYYYLMSQIQPWQFDKIGGADEQIIF